VYPVLYPQICCCYVLFFFRSTIGLRHHSPSPVDIAIVVFTSHAIGLINRSRATSPSRDVCRLPQVSSPSMRVAAASPPQAAARPVVDSAAAAPPRQ